MKWRHTCGVPKQPSQVVQEIGYGDQFRTEDGEFTDVLVDAIRLLDGGRVLRKRAAVLCSDAP
ncbi:hypothetical protein [Streptomyces sp. NPDC048269]|uniref:hypothetical protein n=1 Tax=Streptomyces sp. NPDC048269 TaxID=3155753 RepID=UPI00343CB7E2